MNANASQLERHYQQQRSHQLPQQGEQAIALQRRAVAFILVTVVLLIATCSFWVLSVWAAVVNPTLLPGLWLFNTLTTVLTLLTGVTGVLAAATFVSYRAKVLHCGSSAFLKEN